jgi:hypothetical protein
MRRVLEEANMIKSASIKSRIQALRRTGILLAVGLWLFSLAGDAQSQTGPYVFYPLAPCRIVDTRNPNGPTGGPYLVAGATRGFPIVNHCGVPATAKVAAFNVTAVAPSDYGNLVLYPAGTGQPNTSVVNYSPSDFATANGAIIPLGSYGGNDISVYTNMASGGVHLVIDVTGYFQ